MPEPADHPDSQKLLPTLRRTAGPSGHLHYGDFVRIALYDPEFGYYRKEARRVGRHAEADFYTSQSLGPVFGALIIDAVRNILQVHAGTPLVDLKEWTLVEAGYEADADWWPPEQCPFQQLVRLGAADSLRFSGRCVLFSNELFDAQPFHRIAFLNGRWQELGVDVSGPEIREILLPALSRHVQAFLPQLPALADEGYRMDLPLATRPLLQELTSQPWSGLFVALDYGKSWTELATQYPQGTARAYYKHRQYSDLTARPGRQDLTCHICWDWLREDLVRAGFQSVTLESQESFFVKQASRCIQKIVMANPGRFDPQRQSLMQLIHPATMGQRFQVLWGYRP